MGEYCLTQGQLVAAEVGEELHIVKFPHTWAVANAAGAPVCIPHNGCTLQVIAEDPALAAHRTLGGLRSGQTLDYHIEERCTSGERDVVTLKNGATVHLRELGKTTFQITGERRQ